MNTSKLSALLEALRSAWRWLYVTVAGVLEAIFGFPFFGGVTSALGVLAGFLGSVYEKHIEDAGYHLWQSRQSSEFWLSVIAFGVCFSGTMWAQSRDTRRGRREMMSETDRLKAMVSRLHSLPPAGYLATFETSLRTAGSASVVALRVDVDKTQTEQAIRIVLAAIMALARQFHQQPDARYSVNVMLFRTVPANISADDLAAIESRMMFWDKTANLARFRGYLDLLVALSVSSDDEDKADEKLLPLALPVPHTTTSDSRTLERSSVLPGAPWTFVTGDASGFASIDEVAARAEKGDFAPSLVEAVREHFKAAKGRGNSGMVSLPLPAYSIDPARREEQIGVLNIHRNMDGFMGEGQLELFAPLAAPFCALLSRLIAVYEGRT